MSTDLITRPKASFRLSNKRALCPDDFVEQLFFVVCDRFVEITTREPVAWGQTTVLLRAVRDGFANNGAVFDRPDGGEELFRGSLRHQSGYAMPRSIPGDCFAVQNISWPGARK